MNCGRHCGTRRFPIASALDKREFCPQLFEYDLAILWHCGLLLVIPSFAVPHLGGSDLASRDLSEASHHFFAGRSENKQGFASTNQPIETIR